jgi:2-oxoisovalerate dehydrogenase E2 component (dihydrolipoyl transacylase)
MSRYVFKMPDLGEGTVSAEVVEWKVKVVDTVQEDQVIAEVMTDKAAVEIPSPVTGRVVSINGQPGDMVAVGSELIAFDTSGEAPAEADTAPKEVPKPASAPAAAQEPAATTKPTAPTAAKAPAPVPAAATRVMASPATRRKAHVAGVDLSTVPGSGPGGRISAQDLESVIAGKGSATARPLPPAGASRRSRSSASGASSPSA